MLFLSYLYIVQADPKGPVQTQGELVKELSKQRTALLSVYNKDGIVDFAQSLIDLNFHIISSGGTAKKLTEAGIIVQDVSELVGGEAILGHRVVTLSREIHAGLLAQYDTDVEEMEKLGLGYIDLVCVDMYPLEEAINTSNATLESVIEMTDIGGPCMLRSAAKGRRITICDPADRARVINWLEEGESFREVFIDALCAKAEGAIAKYCLMGAQYRSGGDIRGFIGTKVAEFCYGENAQQAPAFFYSTGSDDPLGLDKLVQIDGTDSSYNNYSDVHHAQLTLNHIAAAFARCNYFPNIALVVKHTNACGASYGDNREEVISKMVIGDPLASFGGCVITNFEINDDLANLIITKEGETKQLIDCIVAPGFTADAVKRLRRYKGKCRMLANSALATDAICMLDNTPITKYVRGGFLWQPNYKLPPVITHEHYKAGELLSPQEELDVLFGAAICRTTFSNTITIVKNAALVGNSAGQQARVYGCENATKRSGERAEGAIAISDSFFPDPDGARKLAEAGITTVVTTSGSRRDEEVFEVFKQAGIKVVARPDKEGRGFRH